jgi:hypothetical protein
MGDALKRIHKGAGIVIGGVHLQWVTASSTGSNTARRSTVQRSVQKSSKQATAAVSTQVCMSPQASPALGGLGVLLLRSKHGSSNAGEVRWLQLSSSY